MTRFWMAGAVAAALAAAPAGAQTQTLKVAPAGDQNMVD